MQQFRVEARCLAFFVVLLFSCPTVFASEQSRLTKGTKWRNSRITLSFSRSLDLSSNIQADLREVLRRSLAAWSHSTDLVFSVVDSDAQSVSPKGIKGDGINLVTAAVTPENLRLFPRQAASPAAVTRMFRDVRGDISEADIVLNPFVRFSSDGSFDTFDLQDTLTHEIGHLLGLQHSPVWGSIMYERGSRSLGPSSYKGSRDELPEVDSSSIKGLYGPRTDDVQCCGSVRGRISGDVANARVLVWIEESKTGRLIAETDPESDGTYALEGVPEGDFRLLVSSESQFNEFTNESRKVALAVGDSIRKNFDLRPSKAEAQVVLLGTSVQLAALPVDLGWNPQSLFLGVKGTPSTITRVAVSTGEGSVELKPSLNRPASYSSVKVVGFEFTSQPYLQKGEYTLVIDGNNGVRQYLVGALIIR